MWPGSAALAARAAGSWGLGDGRSHIWQHGEMDGDRRPIELVHRSGNVFRDFGDPEADLKQAKAVLAARIIAVLDDRGLAVRKAASLTGFAAADFSRIRNADLGRFTLDRLMKMLAALDANARVTVKVSRT